VRPAGASITHPEPRGITVTEATAPARIADRGAKALDLPPDLRPSPDVRSAGDEHMVLLDLASSQYFMLNSTGAQVWRGLEAGVALADLADRLAGAGEPHREVVADAAQQHDDVRREVEELIRYLHGEGLLRRAGEASPQGGTTEHRPAVEAPAPTTATAPAAPRRPPRVFTAWLVVAYVDLMASLFGIRRLLGLLPACPSPPPRQPAADTVDTTIATTVDAVDRAAAFYFRKAWCLSRSAACTWLLRRRAVPARLVLGVRPLPFFAHAWVEVDGRVVNDAERVRRLAVLDRF